MPIKAKTPQKILFEAETMRQKLIAIYGTAIVLEPDWLRSSMQSLLLHVMEDCREQLKNERFYDDERKIWVSPLCPSAFDAGVTKCLAVIQSTIDSIKE